MKKTKFLLWSLMALFALSAGCSDSDDPQPDVPPTPTPTPTPELEKEFDLSVVEVTPVSCMLNIKAKNQLKTFWFNMLEKSEYDKYADEQAVIDGGLDWLRQIAASYGLSFEKMLEDNLFPNVAYDYNENGIFEWGYGYDNNPLKPETQYVIYCFGLDIKGAVTTALSTVEFSTPAVGREDCTFTIEPQNLTSTSFEVLVTPSNEKTTYYYDVFTKDDYEQYCHSNKEEIPLFLDKFIATGMEEQGISKAEAVARIVVQGPQHSDRFPASVNTTYYAFAIGIGVDGTYTTDPYVYEFKTPSESAMQIDFTLSGDGITDDEITVSFHPTSIYETYAYVVVPDDEMMVGGTMPDDETLLKACLANPALRTNAGSMQLYCPNLVPDTAYTLYAFGYSENDEGGAMATTPLFKYPFKTDPRVNYGADAVKISLVKAFKDKLALKFEPKSPYMAYYFDVLPESAYQQDGGNDEALKLDIEKGIQMIMDAQGLTRAEAIASCLNKGEASATTADGNGKGILQPETKYRVYAVGMYTDGSFSSPFVSEVFETLPTREPIEVLFQYNRLDDGIYVWAYPKEDIANLYYIIEHYETDTPSKYASYTDEELLAELVKEENRWTYSIVPNINLGYFPWYTGWVYYVYVVGVDADNEPGPITRERYL